MLAAVEPPFLLEFIKHRPTTTTTTTTATASSNNNATIQTKINREIFILLCAHGEYTNMRLSRAAYCVSTRKMYIYLFVCALSFRSHCDCIYLYIGQYELNAKEKKIIWMVSVLVAVHSSSLCALSVLNLVYWDLHRDWYVEFITMCWVLLLVVRCNANYELSRIDLFAQYLHKVIRQVCGIDSAFSENFTLNGHVHIVAR